MKLTKNLEINIDGPWKPWSFFCIGVGFCNSSMDTYTGLSFMISMGFFAVSIEYLRVKEE